MGMQRTLLVLALTGLPVGAAADPLTFSSGLSQVALVELYTSEGCSSCPPADRWLSGLKTQPALWRDIVPVAFHVDYWDYIGWRDRFASPAHSARQRRHAAEGGLSAVYTPGVLRNGAEWRDWRSGARPGRASGGRVGELRAAVTGDRVSVSFASLAPLSDPVLANVVTLGAGLSTKVQAGENRGRELRHDFVVLAMSAAPLMHGEAGYVGNLPLPSSTTAVPHRALAVWVTAGNKLQPVQATGGWLDVP